jgi:hypothetical protein
MRKNLTMKTSNTSDAKSSLVANRAVIYKQPSHRIHPSAPGGEKDGVVEHIQPTGIPNRGKLDCIVSVWRPTMQHQ